MPIPKNTKIELLLEAYIALESESILQGKTLKKLASELILNGVSKESLNFAKMAIEAAKANRSEDEKVEEILKEIGAPAIKFNQTLLVKAQDKISKEGYWAAMLYIAQNTASLERDELHRVLTICSYHELPPALVATILRELNNI
ncbi:MAG: hypothetical protein ACE14P_02485 [Methanotrichaceae archaeon]